MKIHVGKTYEGTSGNNFKDGEYDLQIISVKATKGRVNMTLATSQKRFMYKTFFLLDKKNNPNENAYRELSDFVTTAMQIEDEDIEVDIRKVVGYYVTCTLKNSVFEREDGSKKATYYLNRPKRCDGFSDGTDSVIEEILSKNKKFARAEEEEEEEDNEEVAEDTTADVEEDSGLDLDQYFDT